jgi:hypothetical protein
MEAASRRVHRVRDYGTSDRSRPARGVLDAGVRPVGVGAGTEVVPAPASGGGHGRSGGPQKRKTKQTTGRRAFDNVRKAVATVRKHLRRGGREERAFEEHLRSHLSLRHECMYTAPDGRVWV